MNTQELLSEIKSGMLLFENIPDFDADKMAYLLRRRLVPTSGQPYAIAQHKDDSTDYSNRTTFFDWHSDGLYVARPPRFVLLHCLDPGKGPTSTELADAKSLLNLMQYEYLYTLGKLRSHYIGHDGNYDHPILSIKGILLASRGFVDPLPGLSLSEQPSIREITQALSVLYGGLDANAIPYKWAAGDTLVFDQYQYLHRRNSAVIDKERKLVRIWFT